MLMLLHRPQCSGKHIPELSLLPMFTFLSTVHLIPESHMHSEKIFMRLSTQKVTKSQREGCLCKLNITPSYKGIKVWSFIICSFPLELCSI